MRMGGLLDQPPGVAEGVDARPPGERLVAYPQPPFCRALGRLTKLRGHALVIIDGALRDIGANQEKGRAELLHQIEFAFDAIEIAQEHIVGDPLEIAKRLIKADFKPAIGGEQPRLLRRAVEEKQIVLEDLDSVEARGGSCLELFRQRSAQ